MVNLGGDCPFSRLLRQAGLTQGLFLYLPHPEGVANYWIIQIFVSFIVIKIIH